MINCPKCGSYDIVGPRYYKNPFGIESLIYKCGCCGYSEHDKTLEQQEKIKEIENGR